MNSTIAASKPLVPILAVNPVEVKPKEAKIKTEGYADVPIKGTKQPKNFGRVSKPTGRVFSKLQDLAVARSRSQSARNLSLTEMQKSVNSQKSLTPVKPIQKTSGVFLSKSQKSIPKSVASYDLGTT